MSEQLYIVTVPCAGGPPVSDVPRTAKQILGNHPSLARNTPEEMAHQCVMAGQWTPHEEAYDATPTSNDRMAAMEQRILAQERELAELRRMKPAASNRMKDSANDR